MIDAPPPGDRSDRSVLAALLVAALLLAAGVGLGFGLALGGGDAATAQGPVPTVTVTSGDNYAEGSVPGQNYPFAQGGGDFTLAPEGIIGGRGKSGEQGAASNGSGTGSTSGSGSGASSGDGSTDGSGGGDVDAGTLQPFTMTAVMQGTPILIGQTRPLAVTLHNPNAIAITIQTVKVTPKTPNKAGCSPSWLTTTSYAGSPTLTIPAGQSRGLTLSVTLVDLPTTNQNACKNATFPLALSGTATS